MRSDKIALGRHALPLVDMQQDFWSSTPSDRADAAGTRRGAARPAGAEGLTVVHVRARFRPDGGDWMARYRLRGWIPASMGRPEPRRCRSPARSRANRS